MYSKSFLAGLLLAAFLPITVQTAEYRVSSASEIESVAGRLKPGDGVVLTNGTWRDQAIALNVNGTADQPVRVIAETPGKVVLTGDSSLTLAGTYIEASGLRIQDCTGTKDGVALTGSHCRLTESAVTDSAFKFFVHLFGDHNRVDHCYLAGKTSESPTLQIEVGEHPNEHRVDSNHFGYRPPLGRNGGETMRVGYSHQSMSVSHTVVEGNLFERCDGELEIISNKSCENTYRGNTFLECAGTLTLRHGNRCLVDGNFFLGNGKRETAGIRVIGEDHVVINNYMAGLDRGAFWITAGIVDSPLKGYFQAQRCLIAFNTVIGARVAAIDPDAGYGTSGRTLHPADITIANNFITFAKGGSLIHGKEAPGIRWLGNVVSGEDQGSEGHAGVRRLEVPLQQDSRGLLRPAADSPLRHAAEGNFSQVTTDIDGQPRDSRPDIGCDEISSTAVRSRPLAPSDVGPVWRRGS